MKIITIWDIAPLIKNERVVVKRVEIEPTCNKYSIPSFCLDNSDDELYNGGCIECEHYGESEHYCTLFQGLATEIPISLAKSRIIRISETSYSEKTSDRKNAHTLDYRAVGIELESTKAEEVVRV
ncbi:MAG: hypothetical protein IKF99_08560 [Oscillospiraceae bacterium]|nr:hypothetical protein [Oscillospiraceae bacterium]